MTQTNDTIRVVIPLKLRRKNGRPRILPPADYKLSEDRTQDPHILRAIGRAWAWRRRMEAGEFGTVEAWPRPSAWVNGMSAACCGWHT